MTIAPIRPDVSRHRRSVLDRRDAAAARVEPRGRRSMTAEERACALVDHGTFTWLKRQHAANAGVVTGWGMVDGRPVVVASHDAAIASGAIGAALAEAVQTAQRFAIDHGYPIVYLNDSGGARIHDGILALDGCGGIFNLNVKATRRIPQISVILGPCAGAAAYSPALTDWTIMVRELGQMFLTGPDIVKAATGEDATAEEIGGAGMHAGTSGVAHLAVDDEEAALAATRQLLSFVPSHAGAPQPVIHAIDPDPIAEARLSSVVPEKASVVFDMNEVLNGVLDRGSRLELMPGYAPSILTILARIDGQPVGIVANQPKARGGILDAKSSVKAARFIDFCNRFGLPVLTFVDVPGFLPGTVEESRGVITHGASLLRAYAEAEVPVLTVIVRKAYGGAYIAMGSPSIGEGLSWAWPGAEVAVMGPGGAVGLLHRRDLAAAEDPAALRDELAAKYREEVASPYVAADAGIVDDVILPEETRARLIGALRVMR
ncbi:MAG: acyl-CoA carboxylase subunit beta [Aeromicrobium sp.]